MRVGPLSACAAAVVLVASLAAVPAAADTPPTLYVTATGQDRGIAWCDDSWPGTASQPLCDIQAAADIAVPGQTVIVDPEGAGLTDLEDVHITRSGTPGQPIVFEVAGSIPAGNQSNVTLTGGANGFVLDGVHDVTLDGFGARNTTSTGIVVSNSSDITIDRTSIAIADNSVDNDGIDVSGGGNITISRSDLDVPGVPVSIGAGVSGADVAENVLDSTGSTGGVLVDGAANTDVTNNDGMSGGCPASMFEVAGGSTGTSIENNIAFDVCTMPTPLLTVAPDSASTTHVDYNVVRANGGKDAYSWAGTSYATAAQLTAATGQGGHDLNVSPMTGSGWIPTAGSPLIDSADANAPGLLGTDYYGHQREDDPTVPNTGTGLGYVDRGAVELQDPLKLAAATNTWQAPVGGTVVLTLTGAPGWAPITGYTVDFGDGTPLVTTTSTTINHVYTAVSSKPYLITATVTDSAGYSTENQNNWMTVVPPAPLVPVMTVERVGGSNSPTFTVDTSRSTDSWPLKSVTCDFGDGTGVSACIHTYQVPGTYRITATVTDDGGNSASTSQLVVTLPIPVAQPNKGGTHCKTCY
jgi:hypothetical protein